MMYTPQYGFRPETLDDIELLCRWQGEPHVHGWWDDEDQFDEGDVVDPRVCRSIGSLGDQSFAYMQDCAGHR